MLKRCLTFVSLIPKAGPADNNVFRKKKRVQPDIRINLQIADRHIVLPE
jgi:hypothetical protein